MISRMALNRADEVLRHIERMAERRHLPIVGPQRGRILVDIVRRIKPKRILEVGTLIGYSTILMGKELESDAEIVTIEIDEDEAEIARENIRRAEVKPSIRVLFGDALEVIADLDGKFDIVFLDAAKSEYLEYLRKAENKLRKGSVIVADNVGIFAYSMRDYIEYVKKSGRYESRLIRVNGDGMEVSIKL